MPAILSGHFIPITCDIGTDILTLHTRQQGSESLQVVRPSCKQSLSVSEAQCELPATRMCLTEEKSPLSLEGLCISGK